MSVMMRMQYVATYVDDGRTRPVVALTKLSIRHLLRRGKYQDNLMWFCSGCLPAVTGFLEGRDPTTSPSRPGKPTGTDAAVNELSKKDRCSGRLCSEDGKASSEERREV